MASGNKVFRAKVTYFLNGVKVPVGSLVREGHDVLKGVEHYFEELHVDFERDDIVAAKAADAEKAKAEVEAQRLEAEAKLKAETAVKADMAKAVPAVESAAVKAVEADAAKVEKAAS